MVASGHPAVASDETDLMWAHIMIPSLHRQNVNMQVIVVSAVILGLYPSQAVVLSLRLFFPFVVAVRNDIMLVVAGQHCFYD